MIFERKFKQCEKCNMRNMCRFKEDYYKNKGGSDWKEELLEEGTCVCKYAKKQGLVK